MIRRCPITGYNPEVSERAYVDPSAQVIGNVKLYDGSSVWPGAVLRGDVGRIAVGEGANVQDLACIHTLARNIVVIGNRTTIGHAAMLHGCQIDEDVLIGMRVTILDDVEIGHHCLIAAGSLIPPGRVIPPYSFVKGSPAKIERTMLLDEELAMIERTWKNYAHYAQKYKEAL